LDSAKRVLNRAEEYYHKIAYQIGYARYGNFWTWNDRVRIIVYPDQKVFMMETQQPFWAKGSAIRHKKLFEQKKIVSFKQDGDFLTTILPHEMAHLIWLDFLGVGRPVPLWFEEGIAQLFEEGYEQKALEIMKYFIREEKQIGIDSLMTLDINNETEILKVSVFYAQSLSIVHFLIKAYGTQSFQQLCGYLKDGRPFVEALRATYTNQIRSIEELEKKWLIYMKN